MKRILHNLFLFAVAAFALTSCNKDENRITFEGGTSPALTANKQGLIPMGFITASQEAVTFSWTNPNYKFTTGVSSQDVTYLVEIDTVGANFTNPNKKAISISKDLSLRLTQAQLNDIMLNQLQLDTSFVHQLEIRIRASLFNNNGVLYSNTLTLSAKPYSIPPKVTPPSTNKLFITGSATPANWQCGCGEPENTTQQFNRLSPTLYELPSIYLNAGGSYLLLPRYGTWSAFPPDPEKYGYNGPNNQNNTMGDDIKAFGGDLLAPSESANYKITVDFQRGKISLVKL
ncbi:MAG: SusE domain-containing protein [Ferruginibacter sp.]